MDRIGIQKEIDSLGRLHIPKELRLLFGITKNVELVITPEGILIKNPEYVLVKRKKQTKNSLNG